MFGMSFLNEVERTQLRAQHRQERDKRICDRIKAVLLRDKGWSIEAIAEVLLLSKDAIQDHVTEYRDLKKLKPENGVSTEKFLYLETSRIRLHFLPPYSPNLNPIERLWKWMKERVIYSTYYQEFEDFKSAIFGFFAMLARLPAESILGKDFRSRVRDRFRPIQVECRGV